MGFRMSNEKNLIPQNKRTKSEQRKIAQKGGIASGIARNEQKRLKTLLDMVLSQKNKEGIPNDLAMTISLVERAISGDVRSFEVIRDTIGEKPTDVVEAIVSDKVDPLISALNPKGDFKDSKK